jgi:hypothetical protein
LVLARRRTARRFVHHVRQTITVLMGRIMVVAISRSPAHLNRVEAVT